MTFQIPESEVDRVCRLEQSSKHHGPHFGSRDGNIRRLSENYCGPYKFTGEIDLFK